MSEPAQVKKIDDESWGYDYVRVRATGNVSYDSFNGDIEFNVNNNESERWISPKNSYLSIKLRIIQTDETGTVGLLSPIVNTGVSKAAATLLSIPFISSNPAACLFTSVNNSIGDESISNNQNIAQCNTLYRTLYESKQEQESVNSTNPIKYMHMVSDSDTTDNKSTILNDVYGSAPNTGYPDTLVNFTNRKLYAMENLMGFNKYNEIEINTQCLAPMMYSDSLIPPNTPFSLRFTVDSNYHLNVISIAGSNVCSLPTGAGGAIPFVISKLSGATTFANANANNRNTIGVGIVDVNLWLYRIHAGNAVSIPREIYIKQFTSTLHAIAAGTHDEFNLDLKKNRRITHIACAFVQKKGSMKTTPTDFSSGYYIGAINGAVDAPLATAITEEIVYSNSPISQLINLRIEYAGGVYPFQPYNYNFDYTSNAGVPNLSGGTYRSFMDYCNFSDGLRDRNGTLLTADQYIIAPIILFKTFQNPDNDSNTLLLSVDFKQQVTGCNMIVVAFYDEVLSVNFDEFGKYTNFAVY